VDTTYIDIQSRAPAGHRVWPVLRSVCSAAGHALRAAARNDVLDRAFTASSSADFATLSPSQQNRLLDRGFRL
jgi:hypothetical protein